MCFTIENTPKKNSYLQKGLNKLRSSTRKSPGRGSRKSPATGAAAHNKSPRKAKASGASRTQPTKAARVTSPPGPSGGRQRRSPRAAASSSTAGQTGRIHSCNLCGKEYNHSSSLSRHRLTHKKSSSSKVGLKDSNYFLISDHSIHY